MEKCNRMIAPKPASPIQSRRLVPLKFRVYELILMAEIRASARAAIQIARRRTLWYCSPTYPNEMIR